MAVNDTDEWVPGGGQRESECCREQNQDLFYFHVKLASCGERCSSRRRRDGWVEHTETLTASDHKRERKARMEARVRLFSLRVCGAHCIAGEHRAIHEQNVGRLPVRQDFLYRTAAFLFHAGLSTPGRGT